MPGQGEIEANRRAFWVHIKRTMVKRRCPAVQLSGSDASQLPALNPSLRETDSTANGMDVRTNSNIRRRNRIVK
jgi:hypothetical protein